MLAVTACYTVSSLSDKYAISKAGFTGNEFTFLMCSSLAVFIAFTLPFQEIRFTLSWQSFAAVLLIGISKMLEFQMSALVLKQLSAFELKAWLGTTLFVSYITDVLYGADLRAVKFGCLAITAAGLILIVRSGREKKIEYRKIILPLALYLASKYGYGLIIKGFSGYASSTMQLLPALILLSLVMLTKVSPKEIMRKNAAAVILARIPNAAGMLLENVIIGISLTNYSFVQPMILVTLFAIGLIRREGSTKLNILGSILCAFGILLFQLL